MPAVSNPANGIASEATKAAKIVESVVGSGWSADASGKFVYMTASTLARLGATLAELSEASPEGFPGWKRIIHPDDYESAAAMWRHCLDTGEHFSVDHRILRSSGAYVWMRSTAQPVHDELGRVVAWYGTLIEGDLPDIAKERFAKAAGETTHQRTGPDGFHSLSRTHPDDRVPAAHAAARAFWTGVPQVTKHRQLQDGGGYRWIETRAEPGYSVSIDVDEVVTDREPPEQTISRFADRVDAEPFRSARTVESLFGNGWAFDAEGRWIYLHPFAQSSLGVTLDDLNAPLAEGYTGWKRLLHPEDYDRVAAEWRHCLKTGDYFNVEFRFKRASGAYVWARTAARPPLDVQGRITGWYGIALDINAYMKTVAALRDRERELSQLVDMVPGHLWRLTADGEPVFFNKRMVDFLGVDVTDIGEPGMSKLEALIQTIHSDDAKPFRDALNWSLVSGEVFSMRYRLRRLDGVYRWMSSRADPLHDQAGQIVQWYGICHDIDDQMHSEEALRKSEQALRELVDALPVNILSFSPDGTMTYASRRYLEQIGSPAAHIGNFDDLARDLAHPEDFPVMFSRASNGFATGQPFVNRFRRRDKFGNYPWIEARAQPLRDASGAILQWYLISIDIEDEVRAQEALRAAQENLSRQSQAASLAELSASIAHEVNQPRAAIVANAHACQRWLAADPPNVERALTTVERVIRDANSAADVVSRIRALFKQSMDGRTLASIDEVMTQARDLLAEEAARRHVSIDLDIDRNLPALLIDRVQVQQVLVNLIRNGIEAMDTLPGDRPLLLRAQSLGSSIRIEVHEQG